MEQTQAIVIAVLTTLLASSGFWTYLLKRKENTSATTRLLMGLAHDKISFIGMKYISRGWVTNEEYEDLCKYLYGPYTELGGNGMIERVMKEVSNLPLKNNVI